MSRHYKTDCQHYTGISPCTYDISCRECLKYSPRGKQIIFIVPSDPALAVVSTSLISSLKTTYDRSWVTVVTLEENLYLFENMTSIQEIVVRDAETFFLLLARRFDIVINLDTDHTSCALARMLNAGEKRGVALTDSGTVAPLDDRADVWFKTLVVTESRRANARATLQLLHDASRLAYRNQDYSLELSRRWIEEGASTLKNLGFPLRKPFIFVSGLGSSRAVPLTLPRKSIERLVSETRTLGLWAFCPDFPGRGTSPITQFSSSLRAGMISHADVVVTGQTLDAHLAVALRRPVVLLSGPLPSSEITLFGRGTKVITDLDCHPCLADDCIYPGNDCMKRISLKGLLKVIRKAIKNSGKTPVAPAPEGIH